jgi:hypothetical protein
MTLKTAYIRVENVNGSNTYSEDFYQPDLVSAESSAGRPAAQDAVVTAVAAAVGENSAARPAAQDAVVTNPTAAGENSAARPAAQQATVTASATATGENSAALPAAQQAPVTVPVHMTAYVRIENPNGSNVYSEDFFIASTIVIPESSAARPAAQQGETSGPAIVYPEASAALSAAQQATVLASASVFPESSAARPAVEAGKIYQLSVAGGSIVPGSNTVINWVDGATGSTAMTINAVAQTSYTINSDTQSRAGFAWPNAIFGVNLPITIAHPDGPFTVLAQMVPAAGRSVVTLSGYNASNGIRASAALVDGNQAYYVNTDSNGNAVTIDPDGTIRISGHVPGDVTWAAIDHTDGAISADAVTPAGIVVVPENSAARPAAQQAQINAIPTANGENSAARPAAQQAAVTASATVFPESSAARPAAQQATAVGSILASGQSSAAIPAAQLGVVTATTLVTPESSAAVSAATPGLALIGVVAQGEASAGRAAADPADVFMVTLVAGHSSAALPAAQVGSVYGTIMVEPEDSAARSAVTAANSGAGEITRIVFPKPLIDIRTRRPLRARDDILVRVKRANGTFTEEFMISTNLQGVPLPIESSTFGFVGDQVWIEFLDKRVSLRSYIGYPLDLRALA